MEWTQSNTDSNETEADYAMNWWKPALGGLLAAGSLVPILARRAPGRKQDARPVTRARLTKLLLKAAHLSPDSEAVQWMSAHCTAQPLVWGDLAAHWLRKEGWLHSALCAGLLLPEDRPAVSYTHLDVYKRQAIDRITNCIRILLKGLLLSINFCQL